MIVGIIGLGLIGGSMAIDLKRRGYADKILGVESEPVNAAAALKMELADEIVSLRDCVEKSDIVVIAIPVGSAVKMLPEILDIFSEEGNGKKIVIRWPEPSIQAHGQPCLIFSMEGLAYSPTRKNLTLRH